MNEEDMIANEVGSELMGRHRQNYSSDPNVQARKRAGRRASNVKSGLDSEYGMDEVDNVTSQEPENTEVDGYAEGGEVLAEGEGGGVVAEAKKELEAVTEEAAEEMAEEAPGEPEAPIEEAVEEVPESTDVVEPPTMDEEVSEPEEATMAVGEYTPPDGETHDALIDKYHEALAFGDIEQARMLYKQLQEHRFAENTHRAKSEAQAEQEAQKFVAVAESLVAAHPELGEDGLAANKVLALSDVYRMEGMSAAESLQKAVADLYHEEGPSITAAKIEAAPAEVVETPIEEPEAPTEEEPAPEAPQDVTEAEPMVPPMEDRLANKRKIVNLPNASARKEETPAPRQPTRSDAIQMMKEKRGQA